jgi:pimeloyl-ACP methyl ester carboxylesterase
MYYEEYGNRNLPTLIMLHGAGFVHSFVNQYSLSDRFHIVIPHLYGGGRESDTLFRTDETVNGIVEIIKSFNKDKVSLVGYSIGAQLIIPIVCRYEQLIDKAILASPWVCKTEKTVKYYSRLTAWTYPISKVKFLVKIQAKLVGLNKEQFEECFEYYRKMTKENLVAYIKDGIDIKNHPEFKDVKIPMLVLAGEKEDREMITSVNYLGEINPNCKVEIWEKYMHDIPFKNPEKFNKVIVDFFK